MTEQNEKIDDEIKGEGKGQEDGKGRKHKTVRQRHRGGKKRIREISQMDMEKYWREVTEAGTSHSLFHPKLTNGDGSMLSVLFIHIHSEHKKSVNL